MLNRRHLRIRVLQFVYYWNKSKQIDLAVFEKEFLNSLANLETLYLLLFKYVLKLRDFSENYLEGSINKKLPSFNDLNPNKKFINNLFLKNLRDKSDLNKRLDRLKLPSTDENIMIKDIHFQMLESEIYNDYMNNHNTTYEDDKKFILNFFSKELIEMESFQEFFNKKDIFWEDDFPFICNLVIKTIKESNSNRIILYNFFNNEVKEFSINLLRNTIVNSDEFAKLISSKTKNWDLKRVAQMDLILMQMALSELLKMPNVPVKVTINEYIELAKYYSTANSKNFVNGILDSLLFELMKEGSIKKTGRGLIE
ncbi:MAG: transcription antitermination factor NusB [Flavobacteriales bacterium]|nr:transcription antitermination factor NusB [Flavobacteriales bacterium]